MTGSSDGETLGKKSKLVSVIQLDRIPQPEEPPTAPDEKTVASEHEFEKNKAHLHSYRQNVQERKFYAQSLFWLIVGWLGLCVMLLFLSAVESPLLSWVVKFEMPETVQLALIGGTTASVLGLFLVVARYLFSDKRDSMPDQQMKDYK